jgi:hypothetical protein
MAELMKKYVNCEEFILPSNGIVKFILVAIEVPDCERGRRQAWNRHLAIGAMLSMVR